MTKTLRSIALPLLCAVALAGTARASEPVVAVVTVEAPWWAPDLLIRQRFASAIPRYAEAPGLLRKYFILSEDGRLGGVYLWRDRAAAEAFYDEAWHRDIEERYGEPAVLTLLASSLQLEGEATPPSDAAEETRTDYVVLVARAKHAPRDLAARVARDRRSAGLLRVYYAPHAEVATAVYLFADARAAKAFSQQAQRSMPGSTSIDRFAAPVVLDAARYRAQLR